MRTFLQKKLWRDKMIDLVEKNHGSKVDWHILDDQEFNKEIRIKLLEEASEVASALSRTNLIEELADLYEVIDALISVNSITKEEIFAEQTRKRNERGGFYGKKFVTQAHHLPGSNPEQYCLADPTKYPEVL